jgi:hypothetical protein
MLKLPIHIRKVKIPKIQENSIMSFAWHHTTGRYSVLIVSALTHPQTFYVTN